MMYIYIHNTQSLKGKFLFLPLHTGGYGVLELNQEST